MIIPVFQELIDQFIAHAHQHYAVETCALIYNDQLQIVPNLAPNPEANFKISNIEMLKGYQSHTGIQALLHSHPIGAATPSISDKRNMKATGCRWLIYAVRERKLWDSENEESDFLRSVKGSV